MRNRGTGSTAKVQNLRTRLDVDVVYATQDSRGDLRAEWVPHAVFNLLGLAVGADNIYTDALLAIY